MRNTVFLLAILVGAATQLIAPLFPSVAAPRPSIRPLHPFRQVPFLAPTTSIGTDRTNVEGEAVPAATVENEARRPRPDFRLLDPSRRSRLP